MGTAKVKMKPLCVVHRPIGEEILARIIVIKEGKICA